MAILSIFALLGVVQLFHAVTGAPVASPAPQAGGNAPATSYWLPSIQRQGVAAFGQPGYQIYRNVKDFGAVGDGKTLLDLPKRFTLTLSRSCG
jgi:hypothetical protein